MVDVNDEILTCKCGLKYPAIWDFTTVRIGSKSVVTDYVCVNERRCPKCQAEFRIAVSELLHRKTSPES